MTAKPFHQVNKQKKMCDISNYALYFLSSGSFYFSQSNSIKTMSVRFYYKRISNGLIFIQEN